MFEKVAFTMFPITDPERARRFYGETLGLKQGLSAPNGDWTEYDLPGGGCIALFKSADLKPSASAGGSIALEVTDLDALIPQLEAKGVTFTQKGIAGPKCRMATIRDSEGNAIILHQLNTK